MQTGDESFDSKPSTNASADVPRKNTRVNSRGQVRPRVYNNCNLPDNMVTHSAVEVTNSCRTEQDIVDPAFKETGVKPADIEAQEINFVECEHGREINTSAATMSPEQENVGAVSSENVCEQTFENIQEDIESETIYYGHTMTVFTSVTLIWIYALTQSITGSQLADLLVLINAHCLENIPVLQSVEHFKNYFAGFKMKMVKHYFCSICSMNVAEEMIVCPNNFCSRDLTNAGAKNYFIEFPINDQLRNLYARPEFRENLKHRFNRKKRQETGIEDIYDGSIYKTLSASGGPLSCPNNISLTWNTDGIPVFKSSKSSIWPMYLMVNELPYKLRKEKCNMIFYGLWFGEAKPEINIFCEPLLNSLNTLEHEGLNINIEGKITNVKAFLICRTADLPAIGNHVEHDSIQWKIQLFTLYSTRSDM